MGWTEQDTPPRCSYRGVCVNQKNYARINHFTTSWSAAHAPDAPLYGFSLALSFSRCSV